MTSEQEQKYRDTLAKASIKIKELMAQINGLKGSGRVAVVGIGCRFPGGADSPEAFWKLLANGVDTVTDVPADRWNMDDWYDPDPSKQGKSYTKRGAFLKLDELKQFDAAFFGISPLEAASLDPQQRLLLETVWEAVERSGTDPKTLRGGQTGVFTGAACSDYVQGTLLSGDTEALNPYSMTGVLPSIASGRISYLLDLHGPNISMDTACSSSLVAILLAMKSLLNHECDSALATGANLMLSPISYIALSRMNALSSNGVCSAFGEEANGFVRGEGCGALYLKRLEDAERAGDPIIAVLRGGAMNHDGQSNGLTAPNAISQQELIRTAISKAGMTADEIDAIETHGTGTPLGDPIEARSLATVFNSKKELLVGSVKTNIGHLEGAAGVAGAIKAILMVNQRQIPPSLHAKQLNSHIPWENIPIKVARELQPFPETERLLAVGVSSFGFSGTNAHLIVQEYRKADGSKHPLSSRATHVFNRKSHWLNPMQLCSRSMNPTAPLSDNKQQLPDITDNFDNAGKNQTENILKALVSMVCTVSGIAVENIDYDINLFELGLDSLMLIQLRDTVNRDYGVTLELSHLMEDANTMRRLAKFVSLNVVPTPSAIPAKTLPSKTPVLLEAGDAAVEKFFATQLDLIQSLMQKQLDALRQGGGVPATERKGMNFRVINLEDETERLTEQQRTFVTDLITRHTKKTRKSKELAQRHRSYQSDWINTLAYRGCLKQISYPIASASSSGATFVDIDNNEYLDLAMGFGVGFFGHNPEFIKAAISERLDRGMELATQIPEAGETAELFCKLTGMERVTFCNTGSDSVMMALRIARTVTKRDRIVLFAGSYHGTTDGVLAVADDGGHVFPTSPGITSGAVGSVTVLPYGTDDSLEKIRAISGELAAILVEPVQSRRPGFQPLEFLQELRNIADNSGAALIFDEMITGFRTHPGGVQALFGIRADIATYGKAVGGGMPISMVAGKARFLDAVDGGFWSYEDDSKPDTEVMFFGGTFCRHPLAIASSLAALRYMEQQGPELQKAVNRRTDRLAKELNSFFVQEKVPVLMQHFGSLFRFESFGQYALLLQPLEMELLFYLLMEKGIFTWERRICFLSTAHTDSDVDRIVTAIKESIAELRAGGFSFSGTTPEPPQPKFRYSTEAPKNISADTRQITATTMSSNQKRLYILSQYDDGDTPYHLTGAALIEGALDVERLTTVFEELTARHESLRTGFEMLDGELVQSVHATVPLVIKFQDAITDNPEEELLHILKTGSATYKLAEAPLMRITLVRFSGTKFILFLDIHHIAADGFSINILISEFVKRYTGDTLPPLNCQYRDYVLQQNIYLQSAEAKRDADWQLKRFAGSLPILDLPADFTRPSQLSFAGDIVRFKFDTTETKQLKKFAGEQGTTLFMLLFASYFTLLHRLSGDEDIIIGTPIAGRNIDFMNTIGMFADTLAVRSTISGDTKFNAFLKKMTLETFQAFEHQQFPLELLVEQLHLHPDVSRNPLFAASFVFEKADDRMAQISNLTLTPLPIPVKTSMFDLSIEVVEELGELSCFLEYSTALFKRESAERWTNYYIQILNEVVKDPDTEICDIKMIPTDELQSLIEGGERLNTVSYSDNITMVQMLEKQAALTPDAQALIYTITGNICDEITISYNRMNQAANQLANYLTDSLHIKKGDIVAVSGSKSPETIIALIAIMKSGAAYLPIDRSLPKERVQYILDDSRARFMISDRDETDLGLPVINMQLLKDELASFSGDNMATAPKPEDLAYIIYTSGSTGTPKGCLIEHKSFAHYFNWFTNYYLAGADYGSFSLFSTIAFDMTMASIFPSLLIGKPLYIYPESMDITEMLQHTFDSNSLIDSVNITPSHISILEHLDIKESNIKFAVVGGEQLTMEQVKILRRLNPGIRIYNEYGPTEFTIGCIAKEILLSDSRITIGYPIADTEVFILNNAKNLLPTGVPGEICLGGAGIARGYLNKPELTAEKFVAHPFKQGERVYRTGDIGIRHSNGEFECLGRYDNQVKIRGFRIELGDIEHALLQITEINQAVITVRNFGASQELVAFYVGKQQNSEDIRKHLTVHLPEYMIPAYTVMLEQLPITNSGKTDLKALALIDISEKGTDSESAKSITRPRNQIEQEIHRIWCEVLHLDSIDIDDNFFSIGGQSLKAVQVIGKIQKELGINLKLRDMFTTPTVAGLASAASSSGRTVLKDIPKIADQDTYPLSHGQKRLWLLDQMEEGSAAYNMTGSWLFAEKIDPARLKNALNDLSMRHEILRTTFEMVAGEPVQRVHAKMEIPFVECDLTQEPDFKTIALQMAYREGTLPFNLKEDALTKVLLIHLPPDPDGTAQTAIVFTMHHIISDGWSVEIMLQELSLLYSGLPATKIAALNIQYRDYAAWQQSLLTSAIGEEGKHYWSSNLAGEIEPLTIEGDFVRPEIMSNSGGSVHFSINSTLTAELNKLSAENNATLFMTILAMINVFLYGRSGQGDIVVGSPVAGREHPDLENQIGLYLNTLPLRNQVCGSETFTQLLAKVRNTVTDGFSHQYYPFDRIVEDLGVEKNPARNPLFDVLFVLQNREESDFVLGNTKAVPFLEEALMSKFDLMFDFKDLAEISGNIEYCSDIFTADRVAAFGEELKKIMAAATKNPEITVAELCELLLHEDDMKTRNELLLAAMSVDEDF